MKYIAIEMKAILIVTVFNLFEKHLPYTQRK